MKILLFFLPWVFFAVGAITPNTVMAQIVSLLVDSEAQQEALVMGQEVRRMLKTEGYEVKEETTREGFFLYVQFMPIKTVREQWKLRGYVGNVLIGSQAWTQVVDSFMPAPCNSTRFRKMKNNVGMDMVLLDSQIFSDASVEGLAEVVSARAHKIIGEKSAEMTTLMMKLVAQ